MLNLMKDDIIAFQSRNRGSFDFKKVVHIGTHLIGMQFQSRNRGSFDFKSVGLVHVS